METGLRKAREAGISVVLCKAGPGSTQGSGIRDAEEGVVEEKSSPNLFEGLEDKKAFVWVPELLILLSSSASLSSQS